MEESNELEVRNEFAAPVSITAEGGLAIAAAREAQEVQGMIISAKRFPRDKFTCVNNILKDCERYSLAEMAEYAYPRGNQTVRGPSIRLAESVAQAWGNIDCGIVELERREGESIAQSFCWDLETNYRKRMTFSVKHERHTKSGSYKLTDPRDIYEMIANQGARRLRACILATIPGDVIEQAQKQCAATLAKGKQGETRSDRLLKMAKAFEKIGVPLEALEKRLQHKVDLCDDSEIVEYISIYNSIKDNQSKRQDWFDIGQGIESDITKELNEKFNGKK